MLVVVMIMVVRVGRQKICIRLAHPQDGKPDDSDTLPTYLTWFCQSWHHGLAGTVGTGTGTHTHSATHSTWAMREDNLSTLLIKENYHVIKWSKSTITNHNTYGGNRGGGWDCYGVALVTSTSASQ